MASSCSPRPGSPAPSRRTPRPSPPRPARDPRATVAPSSIRDHAERSAPLQLPPCPRPPPRPGPARAPATGDRGGAPSLAAAVPLQDPAQRAPDDPLHVRRRDRHDLAGRAQRRSVDSGGSPYQSSGWAPGTPASASRASCAAARRRRSARRRSVRLSGVDTAPAQLADQLGEHERRGPAGAPAVGLVRPGSGSSSSRNRAAAPPRPGTAVTTALPGPGAGDVEQPPLLGQQRGHPGHRRPGGPRAGDDVDQPLVAQHAAAQPQVGPDALLHPGHGDDVPLQALGGVRGEQRDRLAPRGAAASVSAGSCWSARYSRKPAMSAPGSRSVNRAAASNRTSTASRSRSAAAPPGRRGRSRRPPPASPLACHTRQSTSSAVAPSRAACPRWRAAPRPGAAARSRCAGSATSGSGRPARPPRAAPRPAAGRSRTARFGPRLARSPSRPPAAPAVGRDRRPARAAAADRGAGGASATGRPSRAGR